MASEVFFSLYWGGDKVPKGLKSFPYEIYLYNKFISKLTYPNS